MRSSTKIEPTPAGFEAEGRNGSPAKEPAHNDIPLSLKGELVDSNGVPYREFRRGLVPHWGRVWLDIGLCYLILTGTLTALVIWDPSGIAAVAGGIGGAIAIGYVIQMLGCFFHEAAHHNLAPRRNWNDAITNLLLSWMFASSIRDYRRVHFQHHRALGTTMDSENSYFDALGIRYLVQGLVGVKATRAMRQWRHTHKTMKRDPADPAERSTLWIVIGSLVNLALIGALALLGSLTAALAWAGGILIVFPFLSSLRQVLEHRAEDAEPDVDYTRVDHGAVNRIFGDGPIASTLGSAGFNRHALHHWEPQVSYTNLKDIEEYLLRTKIAPLVRDRQTTYGDTFLRLLEL